MAIQSLPRGESSEEGVVHEGGSFSEDCHKLNVWAPAAAKPGDKLPVYVFIHGGGFAIGSGSQRLYDGSILAKQGLVAVTINYRLGGLGFWPSETTLKKYGTTGDWGILDQIKALEWVKNNIANFGGDPGKVTIGGESAGSISVSSLIVSPLAKGLFQQAVMESGTVFSVVGWPITRGELSQALSLGSLMLNSLGLKDDEEGLAALRKIDPQIIARLTEFGWNLLKPAPFGLFPVLDGRAISKDPQKVLAAGSHNRVKLLIGYNHDEGTIFIPEEKDLDALKTGINLFLGANFTPKFLGRFPLQPGNALELARQATAFSIFKAGLKRFADLASTFDDVYVYRFDYVPPEYRKKGLGAIHTIELPFVFGNLSAYGINSAENQKLSQEIQSRWVNFIKTGDPNPKNVPKDSHWPRFNKNSNKILVISETLKNSDWSDAAELNFVAEGLYGPRP
jgi:para-nitrobenzyl esterase